MIVLKDYLIHQSKRLTTLAMPYAISGADSTEENGTDGASGEEGAVNEGATVVDPRNMSDEEKKKRGDMLRNAPAVDVAVNQITATKEKSARKVAEEWWDNNVSEPQTYETEAGEDEINRNSVESSLAHRYGQAKLDAITSLVEGFENAVYIGTMPDSTRQEGVVNHYFAYPINYNGKRCYVFCRALHDNNTNRLYVHEVFIEENIKKGNTLQTAASQPHGGAALYRDILANVLDSSDGKVTNNSINVQENEQENAEKEKKITEESLKQFIGDWEKDPENATKVVDEKGQPIVVYRGGGRLGNIEDDHNNTLYIELSTDNSYWSVNSGGVFRRNYGNNKEEVWSASEEQNKQSATDNTLQATDKSDNPVTSNGNVSNTSASKVTNNSANVQEKEQENAISGLEGYSEEE